MTGSDPVPWFRVSDHQSVSVFISRWTVCIHCPVSTADTSSTDSLTYLSFSADVHTLTSCLLVVDHAQVVRVVCFLQIRREIRNVSAVANSSELVTCIIDDSAYNHVRPNGKCAGRENGWRSYTQKKTNPNWTVNMFRALFAYIRIK